MTSGTRQRRSAVVLLLVLAALPLISGRAAGAAPVFQNACAPAGPLQAQCFALVSAGGSQSRAATDATSPTQPLTPADLKSVYGFDTSRGSGQTIALVDAYDYPSAEHDLAVFRSQYGLPPCTWANGCFRKVNQAGAAGSYPVTDPSTQYPGGWEAEEALDLQAASAVCPNCKLLLVEANTSFLTDLGTAVNTAVKAGASVVSNSWGITENSSLASYDRSWFEHPGVAIVASTGDDGYGGNGSNVGLSTVQYPAASKYVISVGGTRVTKTSTGWTHTAWNRAGSGCSAVEPKPSWQTSSAGCLDRMVADLSADADPASGLHVYDTFKQPGWFVEGGTSLAAPIIAGLIGLAGDGKTYNSAYRFYQPAAKAALTDVVGTANGVCAITAQCTAVAGYDGPTGLGTPNGKPLF